MATIQLDTSLSPSSEDSTKSFLTSPLQATLSPDPDPDPVPVPVVGSAVVYSSTAKADTHIWFYAHKNDKLNVPTTSYLPTSSLTQESLPRRIKCAACQICIPELAKSHFTVRCKPSFRPYTPKVSESEVQHHFVEKTVFDSSCHKCRKRLTKSLPAHVCSWCHYLYHRECLTPEVRSGPCSMGRHAKLILPSSWLVKIEKLPLATATSLPITGKNRMIVLSPLSHHSSPLPFPPDAVEEATPAPANFSVIPQVRGCGGSGTQPLLVFVHPKSGGGQGLGILKEFMWLLNPRQVFDLTKVSPHYALELFSRCDVHVLCCGGDGTAGWVMTAMEELELVRKPPISLLPLGTGNDLSRVSGWGASYLDESLSQVLFQIEAASVKGLDRWNVAVSPLPSATDPPAHRLPGATGSLPVSVMSNYFSIGADAHATLEFHQFRERNKDKPQSRLKNKFIYLKTGSLDWVKRTYLTMCEHIQLECDGRDYTALIRENSYVALVFLNIPSYGAGTDPWGTPNLRKSLFKPQDHGDGLLEVIGLKQSQISLLFVGGHGDRITQARQVKIRTSQTVPVQVDGEPCLLSPSSILVSWKCSAKLLVNSNPKREKHTTKDAPCQDVEALRLSLNTVTLQDFLECGGEIAQLKGTVSCQGYVVCAPSESLSSLRPQVEHTLQSQLLLQPLHPLPAHQPPAHWSFLSIAPGDRHSFMRVLPDQEGLITVKDIPCDGVYVLRLEGAGSENVSLLSDIDTEELQPANGENAVSASLKEALVPEQEVIPASDLSNISQEELEERLFRACSRGDLREVQLLHSHKVDLHCMDSQNRTPLHITASKGHKHLAQFLIDNYPQEAIDIQDKLLSESALHITASAGSKSICKRLVKAQASLTLKDSEGRTPYQRSKQGTDFSLQSYLWTHEQKQRNQKIELDI